MPKKENSRVRILRSANKLFHQHGYDAVTVDQICTDSSSAKGSFYHFFDSKEDLAIALLDDLWNNIEAAMEKTFAIDKAPLAQLRDELQRIHTQSRSSREKTGHINGCPIGFLATTLSSRSEKIRKRASFIYNHMRQFYLTAFEDALDAGELPQEKDPAELADAMLAMVQGIHLLGRTFNSPTRVKRMVNASLTMLTA
jgi:TetR/AcrR family transcriptional regulator, transcriptional repressor for nem operon